MARVKRSKNQPANGTGFSEEQQRVLQEAAAILQVPVQNLETLRDPTTASNPTSSGHEVEPARDGNADIGRLGAPHPNHPDEDEGWLQASMSTSYAETIIF
jgi:hypothetical protein